MSKEERSDDSAMKVLRSNKHLSIRQKGYSQVVSLQWTSCLLSVNVRSNNMCLTHHLGSSIARCSFAWCKIALDQWLLIRLTFVSCTVVTLVSLFVVLYADSLEVAVVGTAVASSLNLTSEVSGSELPRASHYYPVSNAFNGSSHATRFARRSFALRSVSSLTWRAS